MQVVHCKKKSYTVFIGRPSVFGNPFAIGPDCTREEAITKFEEHARSSAQLLEWIKALPEDAILGCFCYPKPCHGDIIMKLWQELNA